MSDSSEEKTRNINMCGCVRVCVGVGVCGCVTVGEQIYMHLNILIYISGVFYIRLGPNTVEVGESFD